jgi:hypothetical protein
LLAKARIFDDFGREVKTLFSNELIGTSGFFTWDGVNADQAKSPIGIYVLVLEVFSVDGGVNLAKKIPFTLAGKL